MLEGRYIPVPESGCWLWTGAWSRSGYGVIKGERKGMAHRSSYEENVGPIPDGMFICHKCDTPPCMNPDHLFLGTSSDNSQDMVRKGRNFRPRGNGLTEDHVRRIFADPRNRAKIGRDFGIAPATVRRIKLGVTWKYLNLLEGD